MKAYHIDRQWLISWLLITLFGILTSGPAAANALERLFAPKADPWIFWDERNDNSGQLIDHARWDSFLQQYVVSGDDGINRLSYAKISTTDQQLLDDYITNLARLPIRSYSGVQQLAYWINLYNALTVQTILRHYPVDSIRKIDISPGFFADGPWGKKLLTIEGQAVSLNNIEHRILRPFWQDPRLHYALNCASLGCPNLQASAFRADTLESMLDQAAINYVNHPRGTSIEDGKLYVSSIYSWFRSDFGDSEAGVINHLKRYAKPSLQNSLSEIHTIAGDRYDWSLNDAP